ncbi:metal-dependent hydrolase [Pseudoalteromonas sp. CST5]|uniref:metal-dependent hydrolase n=1 Tax=unclassified Pseudoalteromonas TaxID=194690 RepID=UPI002358B949|nr:MULTISPECIES: metal-dependent hydrolase [unclassified Pseudoalteromonas]MDC9512202.1 metal-dependent hydrolase [Pseudoalteromonas sp. CST1]MDC9536438.1 metal-dependent hydrolase [Pseudoalteromonas sp. CST3]MDC9541028.1 metal-dependent hydrolase [Pseudoalteromonas sp. CST2]MDC9544221.1 metal-dependent hydrolase [Pseudoalteromonas sp. CST4]MDC9548931.1 metal-dependent hydrolase [Pseudoalteromonas sp. CST5]
MDSLTQVVLGSAVGYAVLGNKIGRKAALWGAALGTLPDLDVFIPYGGPVEAFTYHRGFSHSFIVHLLISPLIVWLILKIHSGMQIHKARWFWLVFLCLSTHALLDSFTVYGTQLIWPLSEHPFAISNIFIIDPLYTLPLFLAFLCTLIPKIHTPRIYKINAAMLVLSSLYLCSSLILKVIINNKIDAAFAHKHIHINNYVSTPAPLTTLLWRVVAMSDGQYYISYASVFDSSEEVTINRYNTSPALLNDIKNEWGVQRLQWFTKGFYSVKEQQNKIVLSDLRMGMECYYVFNFAVGEKTNKGVQVSNFEKLNQRSNLSSLSKVWGRIWNPDVSLAPPYADKNCMKTP